MHWGGSGIRAVFGARDRKNVKKSKKVLTYRLLCDIIREVKQVERATSA